MNTTAGANLREEMVGLASDAIPTRGPVCPKCGAVIPQFADLTDESAARLRHLILEGRKAMATQELHSLIHCPVAWAEIWVLQPLCIIAVRLTEHSSFTPSAGMGGITAAHAAKRLRMATGYGPFSTVKD